MNARDCKTLRQQIRPLWAQGLNTAEMALELQIPEHEAERALHVMLWYRRAIRNSLPRQA